MPTLLNHRCVPAIFRAAAVVCAGLAGFHETQAQPARPIAGTYVCVDAKGSTLTSDRPIPACADREQRVLGPTGTVRARILPPQTPEQRAQTEARERAEAEARSQDREALRMQRALLVRYPNEQAHARERADALARVQSSIDFAQQRVANLQQQQRKLNDEMEFYRKDPSRAPLQLRTQQEDLTRGLEEQQRYIEGQEAERARVVQRFDEELERLKQLWAGAAR